MFKTGVSLQPTKYVSVILSVIILLVSDDDFWDFMPPLAIFLSTLAVLAVVFFIIYLCFCKKENEDEPPLVKSNTESENMEWSEQKNMAYNKCK
jgi:hypothetical protein